MDVDFFFSCSSGPIIAKSKSLFATIKKFSSVEGSKVVSGFKIKAYLVLTFFKPKLLALP